MLVGHDGQVAAFEVAQNARRLHHAWLLAGPEGVGKRAFADAMARQLLGAGQPEAAAALIAAGTHPDLRVLEPPEEGKGSTQKIIPVDMVRDMRTMLHEYPAMGGWRVIIIDAAEYVNPSSSNAMLKELEEPAKNTVFFLVSHAPGRLLPTIRSRCRMLRFGRLADADVVRVLERAGVEPDEAKALAAVADGAPGAALALRAADVPALRRSMEAVMAGGDAVAFARGFGAAGPKYDALLRLVPGRLAAAARAGQGGAIPLYERADLLARDAVRLAYDRVQVAFALASLLAEAGALPSAGRT